MNEFDKRFGADRARDTANGWALFLVLPELRLEGARTPKLGEQPRPERGHADRAGTADDDRTDRSERRRHRAGAHLAQFVRSRDSEPRCDRTSTRLNSSH